MRYLLALFASINICSASDILMVTMGGTKSHKIPFWELAKGMIPRGHNITFLNGFPADFTIDGLHEITPAGLVDYIYNFTYDWDLVGARMNGKLPISLWDVLRYSFESCDVMLNDAETKELLNQHFDLIILDGAYPECALGIAYKFQVPFMYINTVAFYTGSLSLAGNPAPYSIMPAFYSSFTDNMNFWQRFVNTVFYLVSNTVHTISMSILQTVVRRHLGSDVPHVYDYSKNVSFILQNGHASVTYPRPQLPNVAEIACIHCKPAKSLPQDLEEFVHGSGKYGFIYVSMGSSVKAANMPEHLRKMLVQTFAQLPYRVLWKWEGNITCMQDLPQNVKLSRWLPQQDVLGHRKIRAFITHGGLLSMFESVYHGVPVVTMPVFFDHDANAAKAEVDGYALKLNFEQLTTEKLLQGILTVIHDPKYKQAAIIRQRLLLDQRTTPLETAIYWTEYVLRYNGAYHLQSPSRNLSFVQYYMLDLLFSCLAIILAFVALIRRYIKHSSILISKRIKDKIH